MQRLGKSALIFVTLGLLLYAVCFYQAERLVQQTAHSNPFFKIAKASAETADWVILGASHAMPLDFDNFNAQMQQQTQLRLLNLAAPGAGPLYNRFVFEHFLRTRRTRHLLYVVDSFAFYSHVWNEGRFSDVKLLRRTPLEPAIVQGLWDYVVREGVEGRALLDYASGFSKINNRERFEPDVWEGEAQFERAYRSSSSAVKKRIDYLYPDQRLPQSLSRYLEQLSLLIARAQREGIDVAVIKMPLPTAFYSQLAGERAFDQALAQALAVHGLLLHDFSNRIAEPERYFDTDHLNRDGLTEFFKLDLLPLLTTPAVPGRLP
jgi:hypothetical protein